MTPAEIAAAFGRVKEALTGNHRESCSAVYGPVDCDCGQDVAFSDLRAIAEAWPTIQMGDGIVSRQPWVDDSTRRLILAEMEKP